MRAFDDVFIGGGTEILKTPYRTPNANAHTERFVRTVRSECLDHLLTMNERHLERVLRSYVRHYDGHRPHQGIGQRIPGSASTARSIRRSQKSPLELDAASAGLCSDATAWVA